MSNKKLPENATKTEGAELARRGRGEISTATAVPHVSYDDLRHADRIVIDGLEVFANHGVYPEENALGQKFIVSLVLYADLRAAGEHDNLDASIDYGSVCHDVDGYLREHTFKLIEAAAEGTAQMLLRRYPSLLGVRIKLDKPWAPVGLPLASCGVEIERVRYDLDHLTDYAVAYYERIREKYGKVVRVVDIEGWSTEFCGGTHVKNTAQIGGFKIVSESSVAAGIRRIEAVTGRNLLIRANMQEAMLHTVANTLKANNVAALPARAEAVMAENKAMSKELEDIKAKVAASKVTSLFDNAETVGDVKIASAYFTGTSGDTLRGMCDTIRDNAKAAAVAVLVGKSDDKITMAVTVTKDAQAKGLKAGNLVKEISAIAGGKGGGKPDFAMAGLKDETKIDEALAAVKGIVEKQLG